MNIILIGFGTVAQGFVEILVNKSDTLTAQYGLHPRVVAVCTRSRGSLCHPDGLDSEKLLDVGSGKLSAYPETVGLVRDWAPLETITNSNANVMIEAAYSDLDTGQPAIDHVKAALQSGKHVILANKGPVALAFSELNQLARANGLHMRYEATVMAGTPVIQLAQQALAGNTIMRVRGILNGTTNYILGKMEDGMAYAEALQQAQQLGYAEADPTADVDGWDAAGKVRILANALFNRSLTFEDMHVQGISHLTPQDITDAQQHNERWKLIAQADVNGGQVAPVRLPLTDPLAGVGGATNALTMTTDLMGDVTLTGAGAGRRETGFALLSDLISLHTSLKKE